MFLVQPIEKEVVMILHKVSFIAQKGFFSLFFSKKFLHVLWNIFCFLLLVALLGGECWYIDHFVVPTVDPWYTLP